MSGDVVYERELSPSPSSPPPVPEPPHLLPPPLHLLLPPAGHPGVAPHLPLLPLLLPSPPMAEVHLQDVGGSWEELGGLGLARANPPAATAGFVLTHFRLVRPAILLTDFRAQQESEN